MFGGFAWSYNLLLVAGRNGLFEHLVETVFVGMEGLAALVGNAADGTGQTAYTALAHLQIARLFENGDLDTEVTTCAVGDLTQIHEVGTLETVEGYHDLQSQIAVQQRIDDWEFETTHRLVFFDNELHKFHE